MAKKVYNLHNGASFVLPLGGIQAVFVKGVFISEDARAEEWVPAWATSTGTDLTVEDYSETNPVHNPNLEYLGNHQKAIVGVFTTGDFGKAPPPSDNQLARALFEGTADELIKADQEALAALNFIPNEDATPAPNSIKPLGKK